MRAKFSRVSQDHKYFEKFTSESSTKDSKSMETLIIVLVICMVLYYICQHTKTNRSTQMIKLFT